MTSGSSTLVKTHRRSVRLKSIFWFTVTFTIVSAFSFLVFSRQTILQADKILKGDLVQAMEGIAAGVDVEMLLALAENGEKNSAGFSDDPRYLALLEYLDRVHQTDPDVWPYLYIESEDPGYIYFVADLYSLYDPENSAGFMELYESQSGYILLGLEEQTFRAVKSPVVLFFDTVAGWAGSAGNSALQSFLTNISERLNGSFLTPGRDFGTYTDKYGRWASGYMPLESPEGKPRVGLGVDYKAQIVDDLHHNIRRMLGIFYLVSYGFGYAVMIIFSDKFTRPIIDLKDKAEQYRDLGSAAGFTNPERGKFFDEIDELEDMLVQMVEKIQIRDRRYEAVVSAQSDLIVRYNPEGKFTFYNQATLEYFPDIASVNVADVPDIFVTSEDREETRDFIENVLPAFTKENPTYSLEISIKNSKGETRCIQWYIRALFNQYDEMAEIQAVGRDITELRRVYAQLDEANQQLHNLSHKLLNEREQDRAELARELHDDILNYISELFVSAEDLPSEAEKVIYPKLVDKIRSTIYDLRPPLLNYGLYLGLEDLVDGLGERFGSVAEIVFDLTPSDTRFNPDIEIQIFRIIQEACGNALLHAAPSKVRISGEISPDHLDISVEDDGSGFDYSNDLNLAPFDTSRHFGLVGMNERAGLIDAKLHVESNLGEGTKIRVEWSPSEF